MATKSDSATLSGSGTSTSVSQDRPVVMPESFAALDNKNWDSWISHFKDCAIINGWNDGRKAQFLAIRMRGAALLHTPVYQRVCGRTMRHSKRHCAKKLYRRSVSNYRKLNSVLGVTSGTRSCQISPVH